MSSAAVSSARSTASTKTNLGSHQESSTGSPPSLYTTSNDSESSTEADSDNLGNHADDILAAGNAANTAGPSEAARGVTTLSMTLHNIGQTSLDPLSMWLDNSENSRIESLFCGAANKSVSNPAIERWLAEEFEAELDCVSRIVEAAPATS